MIKSVHRLINEGKNVKLRFIGSGYTLKQCKDYVFRNNLSKSVTFDKELPHNELNTFYNNLDLFVLPSYYEALGCVYLESWKPLILLLLRKESRYFRDNTLQLEGVNVG